MSIPTIPNYAMPTGDALPDNRVAWSIAPERAVLLVHDMQNYFVDFFARGGSPCTELIGNTRRMRGMAADADIPVVYSAQPGNMTRRQRGLLFDFWGEGMSDAAEHRDIIAELAPTEQDTVLTKWRYSAFARTDLEGFMRRSGRDQLIICGVYAHVGCLMTACDAFTRDIRPFFVADAMADFSLERHRMALEWAAERCAQVVVADELAAEVGAPGEVSVAGA